MLEVTALRKTYPTGDHALRGVSLTIDGHDAVFIIGPSGAGVCIYRWDIHVRESTVLGLVGAGGIGFALNEAILGLEWSRVGTILLTVLAVVLASEAGSAWLRKRVT